MNEISIKASLADLKETLTCHFGEGIEVFLFGSVARGDYQIDSDIDILILCPFPVDTKQEENIFNLVYDIELKWDVVFGVVVHSKAFWESEKAAVMPFHQTLQKEARQI